MGWFDPVLLVGIVVRELAVFAAIGFLLGGLDDLVIDLIWIGRTTWRSATIYTHHPRADAATLAPPASPGRLAIFVAAWQEDAVIGGMVANALACLRHPDWRLYVGCYPNDPATIAAIERTAAGDSHVRIVVGNAPGPTTKAGCLNWIWQAMVADERTDGMPVKAVVLHDAEDIVHADELTLYDALIERFALVQIPVHPLIVPGVGLSGALISGHYCGEFSEAHGKQVVVREAVGAAVPSAGVGCAIARDVLGTIAGASDGPFDPESLTEDYELGLRIGAAGRARGLRAAARRGRTRAGRGPCLLPAHDPRRGPPEGALDDRHRAGRVGSAGLVGRDRRALDAAARSAGAAGRGGARGRLCGAGRMGRFGSRRPARRARHRRCRRQPR